MAQARLPRPLPIYDVSSDRWPDDDYVIERWKRTMLNRIDQEYGCDVTIYDGDLWELIPIHCGLPEHDPFTSRCWDHTPGNLPSGHLR